MEPEQQKSDDTQIAGSKGGDETVGVSPREATKGSNAGYELAGTIIGSLIIGWLIDRCAHTSPWGILGMLVVGIVAAFMNVWRALNGYDRSVGLHKKDKE